MPELKVFFSHVTAESKIVDVLSSVIQRDFIGLVKLFASSDRTSIPIGSKWLHEITDALKSADLHVVLCSPDSIGRPWINFEAGAAHLRSIPIVPLCYGGLSPAQLPVPISEFEGLSISTSDGIRGFYTVLATALGSQLPDVDFQAYATKLQDIETEYSSRRARLNESAPKQNGVEVIKNPKALCVSSEQFRALGYANQLEKVLRAFPASIQHSVVLDSKSLRQKLTEERFDVVHVGAFICPRSGEVYFSEVDLHTGAPATRPADTISADALAALLKVSETRLVVITGSDSLSLAATLITTSHVVAARDMVSTNMMAAWVDGFYSMLVKLPLSQALKFAIDTSGAPMRLYAKQPPTVDLVLELSQAA